MTASRRGRDDQPTPEVGLARIASATFAGIGAQYERVLERLVGAQLEAAARAVGCEFVVDELAVERLRAFAHQIVQSPPLAGSSGT